MRRTYMGGRIRILIALVALLAITLIMFVLFHLGGIAWQFSQLVGALTGGLITLYAARASNRINEEVEPWLGREQLGWTLIGCGLICWGLGESVWRYYVLSHQTPFPSYADIGYSLLPVLVLLGILFQPFSSGDRGRVIVLMDSLIAMGALLAIGWYIILGSLALSANENILAKYLGPYYPTSDIALLSCVFLLLLRGQGPLYQATARRVSLLIIGLGLTFFAISDIIFNLQNNAGSYVDGTWVDLGWPLGILIIGVAAYLRRFLP